MIREFAKLLAVSYALWGIAACAFYADGHGKKIELDAVVRLTDYEGYPVKNAEVYIVESFSFEAPGVITNSVATDDNGLIHLTGHYCAPVEIATNGGGIVIRPENITSSYTVSVNRSRTPTLAASYGRPQSDALETKQRVINRDCHL